MLVKLLVPSVIFLGTLGAQQHRELDRPVRHPSRGPHGAVAAGSEQATEAGMRMFYRGGNAVDAGVATTLANTPVKKLSAGPDRPANETPRPANETPNTAAPDKLRPIANKK